MSTKLKVLILEDLPADAELVLHELKHGGYEPEWKRVETKADFLAELNQGWEIVLADYSLPLFDGLQALELLRERGLDIPFILVSGTLGEDNAVAAMKAGASNYVMKDKLARLGPVVERELREAVDRRAHKLADEDLKFSNAMLATQQETSIDGILVVNADDKIVSYNRRFIELWAVPPELVALKDDKPVLQFVTTKLADPPAFLERVRYLNAHQQDTSREELILKDGRVFDRYSAPMVGADGHYYGRVWNFRDITKRKQAEEQIRKQAALLDATNDAIYVCALDHTVRYWNRGAERLYGWTSAEALGRKFTDLVIMELAAFELAHAALLKEGAWTGELKQLNKAEQSLVSLCRWTLLREEQGQPEKVLAINTDIPSHRLLNQTRLRNHG
ncbi:MAG: PAS domain S-box protein [Verrucomicrobiota bacterium]